MTGNAILASETLGHLTGLGVEAFVICAGARNAPLVTTLLHSAGEKGCHVWSHFDERTAAFFAMGLARRSARPVAVMTTSGTAVAELLPAVIESFYSGIPLVLVTADRPAHFRGSGAPQAIEQVGLFGQYAPTALDVSSVEELGGIAAWNGKTPLHLNVCFDEPTADDRAAGWERRELSLFRSDSDSSADEALTAFCQNTERPLVLLGSLDESWRAGVERFLKMTGLPFWAEGSSGLRECQALKDQRLGSEFRISELKPGGILRIGGVPSCRFWRDLEGRHEIDVITVSQLEFSGLARVSRVLTCETFPSLKMETQEGWGDDPILLNDTKLEGLLTRHEGSEPSFVRQLSEIIPTEALVFLGNSMPIREWNLAATCAVPHSQCFASRGANGIDGQIATFLGLAEGSDESWGVFGDLTALYDLNAPALLRAETGEKKRIVILNNGGGRIFSRLPSMADLPPAAKRRTENHHDRTFRSWAEMWDLDYVAWHPGDPFPELDREVVVIEAVLNNEATEGFWEARN